MGKLFFYKDLDAHHVICLFGIRLCIKHKINFKYKPALTYGLNKSEERKPRLVVSLTSYPPRIKTIHYTINTLLNQSLKPDKLILWLAKEQFPNGEKDLPDELLKLKTLGLEIEWCEDLGPYKKLIPTLKKYPEDIIVTADDDVYYEEDVLSSLYEAYKNNPSNIYVRRSVKIELRDNELYPVSSRKYFYKHATEPTYFNQIMGGSGCLYPPHSLYKDVFIFNRSKMLIPLHDDVYFWSMAVLNRTKIQVVGGYEKNLFFVDGTQNVGLIKINTREGVGASLDEAYKIMIKNYPEILEIIKEGQAL